MTRKKTFKSRVRSRMEKTGESYTAARRRLLEKREGQQRHALRAEPVRAQKLSDEAVRERTGRSWSEWCARLDAWGASQRTHAEIARWLCAEHQVEPWWSQSLTVAYEQARGLRAPGQQADGSFAGGASRTVAVPVERLFEAFADASVRKRWLPEPIRVRRTTPPKTFRAEWNGGPTRIVAGFTSKGAAKAQVALVHEKLPDAQAAARQKAFWRERLTALARLLEREGRRR